MQTDAKNVLFTEENINDKLLTKIKRSKYETDIESVKLFDRNAKMKKVLFQQKQHFLKKKDNIDRSTLYSFDWFFVPKKRDRHTNCKSKLEENRNNRW